MQVVQFAEHAELRELRYARQEHKAQIVGLTLQRTEQVSHALTDFVLQLRLMDGVEHRRVVLVDEHHHLAVRLTIGRLNDVGQTVTVAVRIVHRDIPFLFKALQNAAYDGMHLFKLIVLAHTQVDSDDGIFHPFFLQSAQGQVLEQVLLALEVCLQRAHEERLAEPSRTAQEVVLARGGHLIDVLRLVHVYIVLPHHLPEGGDAYRIFALFCHSTLFSFDCKFTHKSSEKQ